MAEHLVQEEDGTSRFTLEDGSGSLLLEESGAEVRGFFDQPTPSASQFDEPTPS